MSRDNPGRSRRPSSPPIPTYEEATASVQAESQTLLGADLPGTKNTRRRNGYYQPPSVQSARSSEDDTNLPAPSSFTIEHSDSEDDEYRSVDGDTDSEEGLRQDMEQMDVLDPGELEEGDDRRLFARYGWKGHVLALRRRLSRWKKTWAWRRPAWLEGVSVPLPTWPERWKRYMPGWAVLARLFGLFVIISLGYAFVILEVMPRKGTGQRFDPEGVRIFAQDAVNSNQIREYLKEVTQFSHMAGTEGSEILAGKLRDFMWASGFDDVRVDTYWAYLNWPTANGRKVAIVDPPEMAWEAELEENSPYDNPEPVQANSLAFHGHSRAGDVTAPLVYANYGSPADYKQLFDSGVHINGTIALVRYGGKGVDVATKVKAAEEWGVQGILIYSDPVDDGFIIGDVWPNGRYRPEDSVQRGAVSMSSRIIGDVLTPGWASTEKAQRISLDNNPGLPNIPSIPLSWRNAKPLLQALKGHGEKLDPELNGGNWIGGVPDVDWWTGNKTSPKVHMKNEQKENEKERVFNVVGRIKGDVDTAKKVIVGNHRDSWCFGAADPGSGTAVMLDVIDVLGQLRAQGWRPVRTIEFASWDAGEYNMIGSTEHVESHIDELRRDGVAYLNLGVGVSGPHFHASGSPVMKAALERVLGRVSDPSRNGTVKSVWKQNKGSQFAHLGADSDYAAFQHLAGVSSIDIGFSGEPYPSGSCYETFEWMERFGDPGFQYHKALAEIAVLLILEFAQEPILPLRLDEFAQTILKEIIALQDYAEKLGMPWDGPFDVGPLHTAAETVSVKAKAFYEWEDWWYGQVYGRGGFETQTLEAQRVQHNERVGSFEKYLLDVPRSGKDKASLGIPGRTQFKHLVFGPKLGNAHEGVAFPAVRDAIDREDWKGAQAQLMKAAGLLKNAAQSMKR